MTEDVLGAFPFYKATTLVYLDTILSFETMVLATDTFNLTQ